MADNSVRGRFVWHELMTPDTAGSQSFYTDIIGWKVQAWEQDPSYSMFVATSGPLGGMAHASEAPHWLTYIGTADIEATVAQARNLGARVSKDVTEMPNGGKYAVLEDPEGAAFGVYSSSSDPEPETAPKRGEYSWHELMTTDYRAAFDFYSALFGWEETGEHDMGPLGVYFMFGRNGVPIGGIFNRTDDFPGGPAWTGYVRVKDVHQTAKKAQAAGGTLINGPMEVPGGDWIAQFLDPQGAMFAVHTLKADVKNAETGGVLTAAEASPSAPADSSATAAATGKARKQAAAKQKAAKSAGAKKTAKPAAKKSAKKSAQKSAKKTSSKKKRSTKTVKKAAKKSVSKAAKRATKSGARKSKAKSRATKKKGSAARSTKRPARKTTKAAKKGGKKRSVAKRKTSKSPRKAK